MKNHAINRRQYRYKLIIGMRDCWKESTRIVVRFFIFGKCLLDGGVVDFPRGYRDRMAFLGFEVRRIACTSGI